MAQKIIIAIIRCYQIFLSPIFPSSCRFVPSCSEYALEAVLRYGALKGVCLGAFRLFRCRPFGQAGYDPVP